MNITSSWRIHDGSEHCLKITNGNGCLIQETYIALSILLTAWRVAAYSYIPCYNVRLSSCDRLKNISKIIKGPQSMASRNAWKYQETI